MRGGGAPTIWTEPLVYLVAPNSGTSPSTVDPAGHRWLTPAARDVAVAGKTPGRPSHG